MTTRRSFIRKSALGIAAVSTAPVAVSAVPVNAASIKETGKLKAGIAREIITPKIGGLLAGYGSDKPSTAVNDDLTVTALAIEYGQTKVLLMSATLCLIGNDLTERLRALCGEAAGIPAANVILGTTHTHSGPNTSGEYLDAIFIPKCVAAAKASVREMKPVTVGVGKTESKVGINRRKLTSDDRVLLSNNPWAPHDSEMTVVSFKGDDGKTLANIVHYGCHCTASGINTEITRDWAGVMIDRLDKESGGITMYIQGLEGDIGPRLPNGEDKGFPSSVSGIYGTSGIVYAMELGAVAGIDAVRAYKDIRNYRDEEMSVATGEVKLPHAPLMPLEEARSELAKLEASQPGRWTAGNRNNLNRIIELYEKGDTGESFFTYDQTLIKIGPIVFIPIPFEASTEISLRLRTYSKYGHTLALGCTNGSNSYLVTHDQICRGGYEVERFMSRARQLVNNVDMHLINENIKLMEKFNS
jgi:hypothetical protein